MGRTFRFHARELTCTEHLDPGKKCLVCRFLYVSSIRRSNRWVTNITMMHVPGEVRHYTLLY